MVPDPQCGFVVGTLQSSLISGLNSLTGRSTVPQAYVL